MDKSFLNKRKKTEISRYCAYQRQGKTCPRNKFGASSEPWTATFQCRLVSGECEMTKRGVHACKRGRL